MGTAHIRERLADYHSFLTLVYGLVGTRDPGSDAYREALNQLLNFLQTESSRDIRARAPAIEELSDRMIKAHSEVLPPKKGPRTIAREFRALVATEDVWRTGIPYGWLAERFDVSRLRQPTDLPKHARFGIGEHLGSVQVEEAMLLSDAVFLLLRARESSRRLRHFVKENSTSKDLGAYKSASARSAAVCTYSRLGVLTAAAFVEAFVNSIGLNEADRADLSVEDAEQLRGSKKGRYLQFERKLELFPRLIRPDKKSPLVISDSVQMREPFRRFLNQTKSLRDSSMHYAPGKAVILRPPLEWLGLLEDSISDAVAVGREFWIACYPGRGLPRYLAELHLPSLIRFASDTRASELGNLVNPEHP
jgi:hypothetical protein